MSIDSVLHCRNHMAFVQGTNLDRLELQNLFNEAICHALKTNKESANIGLPVLIVKQIINTLSFGYFFKIYSIPALEAKFTAIEAERKKLSDIRIIQRRWRARLRSKLKAEGKTYETWRVEKITKNRTLPVQDAQKLKEFYKETHYTFIHGQSLQNYFFSLVTTQLARQFKPAHYHPLNTQFRVPETVPALKNHAEFKKRYPVVPNDANIAEELLSVDANMDRDNTSESARFFYQRNHNCSSSYHVKPLYALLPNQNIVYRFAQNVLDFSESIRNESTAGVLYSISIPKKYIQNESTRFAYTSLPYGVEAPKQDIKTLEEHLDGKDNKYQYRLLTSPLSTQKGIRAIPHNHLTNERKKHFEDHAIKFGFIFRLYAAIYAIEKATPETKDWILKAAINYKGHLDSAIVEHLILMKGPLLSDQLIQSLRAT